MITNGQWMVVQDHVGKLATAEVPVKDATTCHTMMRVHPAILDLQKHLLPTPLTLASDSDSDIRDAVNALLQSEGVNWRVVGASMAPGSCLDPTWPDWRPCGSPGSGGGVTEGKVFALERQDDTDKAKWAEVSYETEFHSPYSRAFVTRYCAFVHYEKGP